jgi:hypothetical protein
MKTTTRTNNKYPLHLNEFLYETASISETKVNLLKNYYYSFAKKHLYLNSIFDFKIGSSKNKNLLWMQSYEEKDFHLILHLPSNTFKTIRKNFTKTIYLSPPMFPTEYTENDNLIGSKKESTTCMKQCLVL